MNDRQDRETSPSEEKSASSVTEQSGLRGILVVDDQDFFRESLAEALRRGLDNVAVFPIPNGKQATAVLAAEKIDLVVTDLQMPEIDGVSMLMELKEAGFLGSILVLSGHLSGALQELVLELGALAVIEKPVDLADVVALCAVTLETPDHGIRGLSASGVAQLLALERKTGMLRVSNAEGKGDLFFRDGRLVWALAGNLVGEEAAMEILLWDGVELEILDIVPTFAEEIQRSLQSLLLDSAHGRDESRREEGAEASGKQADGLEIGEAISAVSVPSPEAEVRSSPVEDALAELLRLDGAVEVALIDVEEGKVFGVQRAVANGQVLDEAPEAADAAAAERVCSAIVAIGALNSDGQVEEFSVTLGKHYHLIQALGPDALSHRFLYLVLDRSEADLSLAGGLLGDLQARLFVGK